VGMAYLNLLSGHIVDCLGFLASGATLYTFAQKRMLPMRASAITANIFFIAYGALGPFYPVLILHVVLLPLNIKRLCEQRIGLTQPPQMPIIKGRNVTLMEEWRRNHHRGSPTVSNSMPERPLSDTDSKRADHCAVN
jgi:hypothetical protein